jgi:hypothetical protein
MRQPPRSRSRDGHEEAQKDTKRKTEESDWGDDMGPRVGCRESPSGLDPGVERKIKEVAQEVKEVKDVGVWVTPPRARL